MAFMAVAIVISARSRKSNNIIKRRQRCGEGRVRGRLTLFCSSSKLLNNFMLQEAPQLIPPALAGQSPAPKRKLWKFVVVFLAIILIAVAGYWTWTAYLSPEAKRSRAATENYERLYKGLVTDFEDAMKADTWGGKTPQETLDL